MSESIASVRETSQSKNNVSGNVKSKNGSIYFTTVTTVTNTNTYTTTTTTYQLVAGAAQKTQQVSGTIGKCSIAVRLHQTANATDFSKANGSGNVRINGSNRANTGTSFDTGTALASDSRNAFAANNNDYPGANTITLNGNKQGNNAEVTVTGWFRKIAEQTSKTYQQNTNTTPTSFV
jgi:uncharacterized Zn-binding protein involved in type VI secretion